MAFPKPFFPSIWRTIKRAAPALLWMRWIALALLGILLLLLLVLHLYIVPYIDDFRPRLETWLSQKTQAHVRIADLRAKSTGLFPEFELRGLLIQRPENQTSPDVRIAGSSAASQDPQPAYVLLAIPSLYLDFTWRSALRLAFSELRIERPFVRITRLAPQTLQVGGFTIHTGGPSNPYLQDWFFSQHRLRISASTIVWEDHLHGPSLAALEGRTVTSLLQHRAQSTKVLQLNLAEMRNSSTVHEFDLLLTHTPSVQQGQTSPSTSEGRLSLKAVMHQAPLQIRRGDWRNWQGDIQVQANQFDLAQWLELNQWAPGLKQGQLNLDSLITLDKGVFKTAQVKLTLQDIVLHRNRAQAATKIQKWTTHLRYTHAQPTQDPSASRSAQQSAAHKEQTLTIDDWEINAGSLGVWTLPRTLVHITAGGRRSPQDSTEHSKSPFTNAAKPDTWHWQTDIERIPLRLLSQILSQAPLPSAAFPLQQRLAGMQPSGTLENLSLGFTLAPTRPRISNLQIMGNLKQLTLAPYQGQPGIGGADIRLKVLDHSGSVQIAMNRGWIDLPSVFEQGRIPLNVLRSNLNWSYQRKGNDVDFNIYSDDIVFSNEDAQGNARLRWRSVDAATLAQGGFIDLSGTLTKGNAARVHRYLPLTLQDTVRQYVKSAVLSGDLAQANFVVKGPVAKIPFSHGEKGEFKISTELQNLRFAYLPDELRSPQAISLGQHWPVLEAMSGTLRLNGSSLKLENARGKLEGTPNLTLTQLGATIHQFHNPVVEVSAKAQGPLAEVLERVHLSPLRSVVGTTFDKATVVGKAQYDLALSIPLHDSSKLKVQGAVNLLGASVQLSPDIPKLEALNGVVRFTESGLAIPNLAAQALGGSMVIKGAMARAPMPREDGSPYDTKFEAQGSFSAQGLREAKTLGFLSNVGQYLDGSSSYALKIHFKHGLPEIDFHSPMTGIRSTLPDPLAKAHEEYMPISYLSRLQRHPTLGNIQDHLMLSIGENSQVVKAHFERNLQDDFPVVSRGSIGVGLEPGESPPEPDTGVGASIQLKKINTSEWLQVFAALTGDEEEDTLAKVINPQALTQLQLTRRRLAALTYLPNVLAVRAQDLIVQNRSIRNLLVGGSRENATWRANILADGVSGYVEYTQPEGKSAGHVFARLPQLTLGAQEVSDVKTIVETKTTSVPSLDIVVDDFKLDKLSLGKIVINAENIAQGESSGLDTLDREAHLWRLNEISMTVDEARIEASGFWGHPDQPIPSQSAPNASADASPEAAPPPSPPSNTLNPANKRIRTQFSASASDIGAFLRRLGIEDLHQGGAGSLKGHITWVGSPFAIDYPSLGGQMSVDIRKGQILKVDPGASKLLSLFSLQFLPRLLTLDLRNEFGKGFAYDTLRGNIVIDQGVAQTTDTVMDSASLARVEVSGSTNVATTAQDLSVKVVPQISLASAAVAAGLFNPTLFVLFPAQWVAGKWLAWVATENYQVKGDWSNPIINKVKP